MPQNYCTGRIKSRFDSRDLMLSDFLPAFLPPPAASYNALERVFVNLKTSNVPMLFPMDGNDTKGDCTCAAWAHGLTVFDGFLGKKTIWSTPTVEQMYFTLTGGPDSGLQEIDVLNYLRKQGLILGHVSVNPSNLTHCKQAMSMFGGLYIGFNVQQDAIPDFDARKPWTAGPLTGDGHAVYVTSYENLEAAFAGQLLTWGDTEDFGPSWWSCCVDEVHAILPLEAKQPGFLPGFDLQKFETALAAVTN